MQTIKHIKVEMGEECRIDVDMLHDGLIKLPAEMYLDLYRKMHMNIYGYPPITNFGGCCGTYEENKPELKAKIDYSEVDETMAKVAEANEVADKLNALLDEISKKDASVYIDVE